MHIPLRTKLTTIRLLLAALLIAACHLLTFGWLQSVGIVGLLFISGTELFQMLLRPAYKEHFIPYRVRITLNLKLMLEDAGLVNDQLSFEKVLDNSPGLIEFLRGLDFTVVSNHNLRKLIYWNSFHTFASTVKVAQRISGLDGEFEDQFIIFPNIFLRQGWKGYEIGLAIPEKWKTSPTIEPLRQDGVDRNTFIFAFIPSAFFDEYYNQTDDRKRLDSTENERKRIVSIAKSTGWVIEDRSLRHRYATLDEAGI